MTTHEAFRYWLMKYNAAKNYTDEHWDAEERHEHQDYVEALEKTIEMFDLVIANDETKLRIGYEKYKTAEKEFLKSLRVKNRQRADRVIQINEWDGDSE